MNWENSQNDFTMMTSPHILTWLLLLPPPRLCFVVLSVSLLDYSKSRERISMKSFGGVGHGSMTNQYSIRFWWQSRSRLRFQMREFLEDFLDEILGGLGGVWPKNSELSQE